MASGSAGGGKVLASLNVKGLNSPSKRSLVRSVFRKESLSILLLQETHFCKQREFSLTDARIKHVYLASAVNKKGGVGILLSGDTDFRLKAVSRDKDGRYVFLKGWLQEELLTIVSIYCPNTDQLSFLSSTLIKLSNFMEGGLIIGGDCNLVWNAKMDRLSTRAEGSGSLGDSSRSFNRLMSDMGLCDVWREVNPSTRAYTYYSPPHGSFSRIDYIFLPPGMLHLVRGSEIKPTPWSDHDLVKITFLSWPSFHSRNSWRCNDFLFKDPVHREEIGEAIRDYFKFNDTGDVSQGTLWEAAKATLRGELMSRDAALKRLRRASEERLRTELEMLEKDLATREDVSFDLNA